MSMIDRGVKRRCASCEAPFYDMGRTPIVCPKCGAHFEVGAKRLVSAPRSPKTRAPRSAFGAAAKAAITNGSEEIATGQPPVAAAEDGPLDDAELEADEVEEVDEDEGDTESDADDTARHQ